MRMEGRKYLVEEGLGSKARRERLGRTTKAARTTSWLGSNDPARKTNQTLGFRQSSLTGEILTRWMRRRVKRSECSKQLIPMRLSPAIYASRRSDAVVRTEREKKNQALTRAYRRRCDNPCGCRSPKGSGLLNAYLRRALANKHLVQGQGR